MLGKMDRRDLSVAETILEQLGGQRFLAMTGACDLVASDRSLVFRLPANLVRGGGNKMEITLDSSDTYTLTLFRVRGAEIAVLDQATGVFAAELQNAFRHMTGLDTHL